MDVDQRWEATALRLARRAREASHPLARATREQKDRVLLRLAESLSVNQSRLLEANARDVEAARAAAMAPALIDRLVLNPKRIDDMIRGLQDVAALPDPVGEETEHWTRPNGMRVARVGIPLGVILMIYESRPNVTVDAAALCLKSGNAVILRGGKEARSSNEALANLLRDVLLLEGLPEDCCLFVPESDRELMLALLQQDALIDLCIPRGGEGLIRFVAQHSRVPVIKHYKGVCHLYVDAAADLGMALTLVENGKVSRPSACNALECLLVHRDVAGKLLPQLGERLGRAGVELRADAAALPLLHSSGPVVPLRPEDLGTEFLALVLVVKVVDSYEEAIAHILRYGSLHTECIVTEDAAVARRFLRDVDASMVGWNVSTRFNDGGELGLGAEMGISTTKLHAFGPMGLRELTTRKFVVTGEGQVRR